MKSTFRIALAITQIVLLWLMLIPSMTLAAGACTYGGMTIGKNNVDSVRYYRYTCVASAAALSAELDVTPMQGRTCTKFVTSPVSGSAPTDNSELAYVANGITYIGAAGKGLNVIDSTTTNWDYFEGNMAADDSANGYYEPVDGKNGTVTMTNNAVALGSFYLDFICY